jgi:hypothetical protein
MENFSSVTAGCGHIWWGHFFFNIILALENQ